MTSREERAKELLSLSRHDHKVERFLSLKPTCAECKKHNGQWDQCRITHSNKSFVCDQCKRQHIACSLRQDFLDREFRMLRLAEKNKLGIAEEHSRQGAKVQEKSPRKDESFRSVLESASAPVQKKQKRERSISPGSATSSTAVISEPLLKIGPPKKKKQKEPNFVTPNDQSTESDAATIKRLERENSELRSQLEDLKQQAQPPEVQGDLLIECCSQLAPLLVDMKTRLTRLRHFVPKPKDGKEFEKGDADWNALKDRIEELETLKSTSGGTSNQSAELEELRHARGEDSKHLVILSGMLNNFVRTFANHGKTFGNHGLDTKTYTADLEHLQVLIDSTLERTSAASGKHWSVSALR